MLCLNWNFPVHVFSVKFLTLCLVKNWFCVCIVRCYQGQFICARVSYFVFSVCITSAIDCLERLVSEMTRYMSSGSLNHTHSLTGTKLQTVPCVSQHLHNMHSFIHLCSWNLRRELALQFPSFPQFGLILGPSLLWSVLHSGATPILEAVTGW